MCIRDRYMNLVAESTVQRSGKGRRAVVHEDDDAGYKKVRASDINFGPAGDDDESIPSEDEPDVSIPPPRRTLREDNIERSLAQIEKEDEAQQEKRAATAVDELAKAQGISHQLKLWEKLVNVSILMHKIKSFANKLPQNELFGAFVAQGEEDLGEELKYAQVITLEVIQLLQTLRCLSQEGQEEEHVDFLAGLAEELRARGCTKEEFVSGLDIDANAVWAPLERRHQTMKRTAEAAIKTWAQKVNIMSGLNTKGPRLQSLVLTPVEQTYQVLANADRVLQKTRIKRNPYRVLGKGLETLDNPVDAEIYDDADFNLELIKEVMTDDPRLGEEQPTEDGLLLQSTRKYLIEKSLKGAKESKEVDRRASKQRKLRYEVHQKLQNFMTPIDNIDEVAGRDELIQSIFRSDDVPAASSAENSAKKQSKRAPPPEEPAFALI
eukprot:TRINITY_DN4052_c0_g1_i4.p1 TRINITY_DN4052_c0_g1~~TRINITY_DN4052_c0_g1_i4.p1  ORF type:complete len:463 (-),score=130.25 TRINITY_DN4052_c0_g1_i4:27-1337(-)